MINHLYAMIQYNEACKMESHGRLFSKLTIIYRIWMKSNKSHPLRYINAGHVAIPQSGLHSPGLKPGCTLQLSYRHWQYYVGVVVPYAQVAE